ncbi:MAG TPA: isoprenylcysteine carboxylmethyltransferase family protein [Gemmatimonadaceae bacterium]
MTTPPVSAAERSQAARVGAVLFRNRSWLPVPFLAIPLFVPGNQTLRGWLVAMAVIVVGELVRMAGVAAAGSVTRRRSRDVQRLVTYGIFAWLRNPLYVGNLMIWIGFVIGSGLLWFIPVAIALFGVEYSLIVRYEEGVLESIFGAEYVAYKQRTPRWFPKPPSKVAAGEYDWLEALRSEVSTFAQYAALGAAFWVKTHISWRP